MPWFIPLLVAAAGTAVCSALSRQEASKQKDMSAQAQHLVETLLGDLQHQRGQEARARVAMLREALLDPALSYDSRRALIGRLREELDHLDDLR